MNEWKLHVGNTIGGVAIELVIYRNIPNNGIEILQFNANNTTSTVYRDEGMYRTEDVTMRIHPEDFNQIVKAFVKYSRDKDFKDSNESYTEGKLLATEKHLEDMRTLVFEPQTIINEGKMQ
jgi:hypothetical protein